MKIIRKYQRFISINMIFVLFNTVWPSLSMAITGSSTMPEYRSFEPVSSANMVNMLDGSFSYNIPLMDVPNGYPLNISYNSNDVNNEAQASWVGLGWTLNPGAINRIKRGVPDEFDNESITYHRRIERNWTVGIGATASFELFSNGPTGLNLGGTIRYNNFQGFSSALNLGSSFGFGPVGIGSLNLSMSSNGGFGFSPELNPSVTIKGKVDEEKEVQFKEAKRVVADYKEYLMEAMSRSMMIKSETSFEQTLMKGDGRSRSKGNIGYSAVNHLGLSSPQYEEKGGSYKFEFTVGPNVTPAQTDVEVGLNATYVTKKPKNDSETSKAYGYFNSHKAMDDENALMDYKTERENIYEKRDKILGYPIAESDVFSVTGEGVGGSFRAFRNKFGYYKKNKVTTNIETVNVGVDANLPSGIWPGGLNATGAIGGSLHGGNQKTEVGNWDHPLIKGYEGKRYKFESAKELEFRFSNDLAGNIDNANGKEWVRASGEGGDFGLSLNMNLTFDENDLNNKTGKIKGRVRKSTDIQMSKNSDFDKVSSISSQSGDMQYLVHTQDLHILNENDEVVLYDRKADAGYRDNGIGEFMMHNSDGVKYVYGLPLHTKNEKQLSYSTDKLGGLTPTNSLLFEPIGEQAIALENAASRKQGYEQDAAYATQNLLTEIISPDYVDRTMNGPTPDDFGSYTKFNYKRVAGGNSDWYNYRSPYEGMSYTQGSLTDKKDNMASVTWGEKELYYVHSVVSKTHVAIFRLEDRDDGRGLPDATNTAGVIFPTGTDGIKSLKKLTRIDLYSLSSCKEKDAESGIYFPDEDAVPIKTVHFDYDYSLCSKLPNNKNNEGKLTLKKIWFDYGGKKTSKVSPYEFKYEYPSNGVYSAKYQDLDDHYSYTDENSDYNVFNTDRWGNYFNFSKVKTILGNDLPSDGLAPFFPYVYQGNGAKFDPGAYKLKQIVLPSGGEIHVQYEQGDYQYVQDKRAMVMAPLSHTDEGHKGRFYIDLNKIGVSLPADHTKRKEFVDDLFAPMKDPNSYDRMYFNFLYRLVGSGAPDVTRRQSEYIEGYVRIRNYGFIGNDVFFSFSNDDDKDNATEYINAINYPTELRPSRKEIPQKVCKSFYKSQRVGKTSTKSSGGVDDSGNKEALVNRLLDKFKDLPNIDGVCGTMSPKMSYVRLQMPVKNESGPISEFSTDPLYAKKGGSVRVKRLLLVDYATNLEDHSGSLEPFIYGNEYIYKTKLNGTGPVISSGVATFEPQNGRRENALVKPIDKLKQTRTHSLLFGRDMYDMEEPFGESLYPSPSVGYSKVIMKNIHDGVTSTGYEEHEYYTCKDFPFEASKSPIDLKREVPISIGASFGNETSFGFSYQRKAPYLFQGYSFVMNDMHGKPKAVRKYSGIDTQGKASLITSQRFEYSKPGETVPVMDENRTVSNQVLGTEGEVYAALNQITDFGVYGSASGELTVGGWTAGLLAAATFLPTLKGLSMSISDMSNRTHVTTKVVRYATVLKSKTATANGITSVTYNDVFDGHTGSPVITRTLDDFDNEYQNVDIKASWMYPNMGSTAQNAGATVSGGTVQVDNGVAYIAFDPQTCGALDNFTRGDLVQVKSSDPANTSIYLYHTDEPDHDNNRIAVLRSGYSKDALTAGQVTGEIKVIRSGYTNELNVSTGGYSTHSKKGNSPSLATEVYGESDVQFIKDLNTALDGITNVNGKNDLILSGGTDGYKNISLGLDNCILDDVCESGSTLKNVLIKYIPPNDDNNNFSLAVESFKVEKLNGDYELIERPTPTSSRPVEVAVAPGIDLDIENERQRNQIPLSVSKKTVSKQITPVSYNVSSCSNINYSTRTERWDGGTGWGIVRSDGRGNSWETRVPLRSRMRFELKNVSSGERERCSYSFNIKNGKDGSSENPERVPGTVVFYDEMDKPGKHVIDGNIRFAAKGERIFTGACGKTVGGSISAEYCIPFNPAHNITVTQIDGCDLTSVNLTLDFLYRGANKEISSWQNTKLIDLDVTWIFTDANNVNDQIVSKELYPEWPFTNPGLYKVLLNIKDAEFGGEQESELTFRVTDCHPCSQLISLSEQNPCWLGNDVTVDISATGIVGETTCDQASYKWYVQKEGQPESFVSSAKSFTQTFSASGKYDVILKTNRTLGDGSQQAEEVRETFINVVDCRTPQATIVVENGSCPDKTVTFTASPVETDVAITKYYWDFGDGTIIENGSNTMRHTYSDCNPYTVKLRVSNSNNDSENNPYSESTARYLGNDKIACHPIFECTPSFPLEKDRTISGNVKFTQAHGKFSYNKNNGSFVYRKVSCPTAYKYPCFSLCGENPILVEKKTITNVVASSATTFSDDWDYDDAYYPGAINDYLNDYETGRKGNWRPDAQFVYREGVSQGNNYEAGTFTMTLFDWENLDNNDATKWVNTSNTLAYSPNGEPTLDVNILGVYSTSKYGYNGTLPVLVAQNANDHTVAYESFENKYPSSGKEYFEDGFEYNSSEGTRVTTEAHTGKYSLELQSGTTLTLPSINIQDNRGVVSRVWIKNTESPDALNNLLTLNVGTESVKMIRISSGGEWQLYEGIVPTSGQSYETMSISLSNDFDGAVYFDDFRVQPLESEMVCYVYDEAQRLIAVLDDQHYAMLYQYNTEGVLVRKLKETVQGVKTISETQYNTKGVQRKDLKK